MKYVQCIHKKFVSIAATDGSSLQYQYIKDNIVSSVTRTINGTTKTTSYSYDDSDKLIGVTTVNGSTLSYAYDSLGRTDHRDITLANGSYVTAYTYTAGTNSTTTGKVASISNNGVVTQYTYDANNNISTITSGGKVIAYTYNSLDELVREDNQVLNKTIVYSYDAGGNILSKTEYPYTIGQTLGTATNTITYTYGDSTWKDKLTSYNGNAITYDAAGNTLTYNGYSFSWEAGRQLAAMSGNGQNISYKYNDSGYRTEKTINGITTKYYLDGDKVVLENTGSDSIYYSYDAENNLVSLTLNNTEYFYIRNGQGDITGLIDTAGVRVVSYIYDSWGKLVSIDGSLKDTVGLQNPYRYRGYIYDTETRLYYLQSRYYNPEIGRYINADNVEFLGATGTLLSHNLFAYCENNPVNNNDPSGYASYSNTIIPNSNGWNIKTVINILWTKLTYNYNVTTRGVISFYFSKNNYWSVLWRGGGKTLAEAMYKAIKSIKRTFLQGRTIGGINTELQLHWAAFTLGIATDHTNPADIGGMWGTGYDYNAFFWEGVNAAKIVAKLNIYNVWGIASLVRGIHRYF